MRDSQRSVQQVRKHRAPKGALRLSGLLGSLGVSFVRQKAPSAKRCIKTHSCPSGRTSTGLVRKHRAPKGALRLGAYAMTGVDLPDQKAPSAKRCIKTATKRGPFARCPGAVRKHRAPNGALRPRTKSCPVFPAYVRKHRAPNGALRPETLVHDDKILSESESTERQTVH